MAKIELGNGYFIEEDPLNYTLKERFPGKTKKGIEKESVRVCGFYGDVVDAVKRYITLERMSLMEDEVVSIHEYIKVLECHENEIVERLEKVFGQYPVK